MTAAVLADTPPPTTVQEDSFEASSEPAEGSQVDVLKEEDEMELATPSVNLDGGFGSLFPHVHPKAILAKAKAAKEAKEAAFKAKAKAKVDALVNHLYQKNKKVRRNILYIIKKKMLFFSLFFLHKNYLLLI